MTRALLALVFNENRHPSSAVLSREANVQGMWLKPGPVSFRYDGKLASGETSRPSVLDGRPVPANTRLSLRSDGSLGFEPSH